MATESTPPTCVWILLGGMVRSCQYVAYRSGPCRHFLLRLCFLELGHTNFKSVVAFNLSLEAQRHRRPDGTRDPGASWTPEQRAPEGTEDLTVQGTRRYSGRAGREIQGVRRHEAEARCIFQRGADGMVNYVTGSVIITPQENF